MKIGIDKIGFHIPHYYVDMEELAEARGVEPAKLTVGIGHDTMAVAPVTQDPVTLAANAALNIIDETDRDAIDFVMFGTETGIDHSKSAGVYVHRLLGLKPNARTIDMKQACYGATAAIQLAKGHIALNPESKVLVLASDIARYVLKTAGVYVHRLLGIKPNARTIEMKQACYGATAAIQLAKGHIALNPESKVLVLASDIARYGLKTAGEVTQGAGAVAMVISADPKI